MKPAVFPENVYSQQKENRTIPIKIKSKEIKLQSVDGEVAGEVYITSAPCTSAPQQ
jgi:hypothetical protein